MELQDLRRNWEAFGRTDPHWAVLTDPAQQGGRWDEEAFYRVGVEDVRHVMARLAAHGLPRARERALDFGCGLGRIALPLADHFTEVVGVDIAEAMLERARRRDTGGRVRFVHNAAPDLSRFADATFDFVHSRLVLQHIPPRLVRRYLREFVRVARPGAAILFNLPAHEAYVPPVHPALRRLPPRLVRAYRRMKRIARFVFRPSAPPVMGAYGLGRRETVRLLESAGARVLDVRPDQSHGTDRPGFEYIAVRRG